MVKVAVVIPELPPVRCTYGTGEQIRLGLCPIKHACRLRGGPPNLALSSDVTVRHWLVPKRLPNQAPREARRRAVQPLSRRCGAFVRLDGRRARHLPRLPHRTRPGATVTRTGLFGRAPLAVQLAV